MYKYGHQITQALEKDFENHVEIFSSLQKFMREQLLPAITNMDNFKAQSMSGAYSNQLELCIEHVVSYLREQLNSGLRNNNLIEKTVNDKKVILGTELENIARRSERYFYYHCFVYLINRLDSPLRDKLVLYLSDILQVNQFDNFVSFYNDKVSPFYNIVRIKNFPPNILSRIFINILVNIRSIIIRISTQCR